MANDNDIISLRGGHLAVVDQNDLARSFILLISRKFMNIINMNGQAHYSPRHLTEPLNVHLNAEIRHGLSTLNSVHPGLAQEMIE